MMFISVISLIISFLLQGLMSNFFNYTINGLSIFSTVYLVANIVVLNQYFDDDKKFLILIIIFGLLVDIVYTDTVLLNVFLFTIIFYINKKISSFLPYNVMMVNLFSIISIITYHLITFVFLKILSFDSFTIFTLVKIIGCNIIMTIMYTIILYLLIDKIYKRFDLKMIRN